MVPSYRPPPGVPGVPVYAAARRNVAGASARQVADMRRRQTLRRRRDVLFVLVIAVAATLVMAVATRSRGLEYIQFVTDLLFVAYVALLVRLRNTAGSRALDVRYQPRQPVYGRRNEPQERDGYYMGSYGSIARSA